MRGLFVTGTSTDIGKTYVSAAIARELTKKNLKLAYYKAAVSGSDCIEHSDAGYVRDHANIKQSTESLLSYLYEKPLSPHLAGRGENRFAKLDKILEKYLNVEKVTLIPCGGNDEIASEREQWNDGSNTLCIAPGVVIVYDRNNITNAVLRRYGIKVLEMHGSELSRGRGGPRCMSMPLVRSDN